MSCLPYYWAAIMSNWQVNNVLPRLARWTNLNAETSNRRSKYMVKGISSRLKKFSKPPGNFASKLIMTSIDSRPCNCRMHTCGVLLLPPTNICSCCLSASLASLLTLCQVVLSNSILQPNKKASRQSSRVPTGSSLSRWRGKYVRRAAGSSGPLHHMNAQVHASYIPPVKLRCCCVARTRDRLDSNPCFCLHFLSSDRSSSTYVSIHLSQPLSAREYAWQQPTVTLIADLPFQQPCRLF